MTVPPGPSAPVGPPASGVLWTRPVDHVRHRRRTRGFLLLYVLPVAIIAIVFAIVASPAEAVGFLILTGGFGLLLGGWVLLQNLNERTRGTIAVDGGRIICGRTSVAIDGVESWTTISTVVHGPSSMSTDGTTGPSFSTPMGIARFKMTDGKAIQLAWPAMDEAQLAGVHAALASVLPDRERPES